MGKGKGKGKKGYGPRWWSKTTSGGYDSGQKAYAIPDYHGRAYALVGRRWVRFGGKGKGKGKGKWRAKGTHGKRRDEDEFYEQQRREGEGDYYYPGWEDDCDMFGEGESADDCEWWNGQWWMW